MNRNVELNLSLDFGTLALPSQYFFELSYISVGLQFMLDLLNGQLIGIGKSILLPTISKHIRFEVMYVVSFDLEPDLVLIFDDAWVAVGVLVDALDSRGCDLCDLLGKLREEVAFADVLFGDLILGVETSEILEGELYSADVSSMGFELL